jgi:hypothetical protein
MSIFFIFVIYFQLLISGIAFLNGVSMLMTSLFASLPDALLWWGAISFVSGFFFGITVYRIHRREIILYYEVARVFYPIAFLLGTGFTLVTAHFLWENLVQVRENALIPVFAAVVYAVIIVMKWVEVRFLPEFGDFEENP